MNVPLSWLRDFVDIDLAPHELAARLTLAGVEVEALHEVGAEWDNIYVGYVEAVERHPNADRLSLARVVAGEHQLTVVTGAPNIAQGQKVALALVGARLWDNIYVGYVEAVERHPNADRLSLARVVAGEHQLTVVTGAPNIAQGQKVALALVGARLWDGHSEEPKRITLKASTIRGVPSEGMVCSEKELGLSEEHEGILALPDDAPVGVPLKDYLGDTVLELEITPNLVHDFSVLGVAREVGALTRRPLHPPPVPALPEPDSGASALAGGSLVTVEAPDLCPRYVAVAIEGVTVGPSPEWLQRRLTLAGLRPINNIVDITNYVMIEYGQPQHAFDRDRLAGGRIVVRRARAGERMETLDHVMRTLDTQMLTIADTEKAVGLAGVMGGLVSEIDDNTTNVLLESANFDMYATRHTMQTLKLPTDAAVRFHRGLDPNLAWPAAERATALILELCPGARVVATADVYPNPATERTVDLPYGDLKRLLGVTYPVAETVEVLGRLDLRAAVEERPDGDTILHVTVPTYRQDITQSADLVEEVIRIIGYDTLPETLPEGRTQPPERDPSRAFADEVRDILAASGLREIICYSLTDEPTLDRLTPDGHWTTWWEGHRPSFDSTRLVNTLRSDWQILRPTLMADALATLAEGLKYRPAARLFEARPVYLPRALGQQPTERLTLSIALAGARSPRDLYTPAADAGAPLDFFDLKGVVEALLARLGITDVAYQPSEYGAFHPGRAAELLIGGDLIGVFGEVHPAVAANFGLTVPRVMLAELDLALLETKLPSRHELRPLPRFQPVVQDFAVVVDEATPAGTVQRAILTAAKPLAESARLFDVYRGEQIPSGQKSLAFEVTFAAPNRALAEHELTRLRERIATTLRKQLKASLRT